MSGSPLSEFTTFAQSQGPAWASSAESLVNEAAKRVYTISRITAHKDPMEYCQGGDEIKDRIYFDVKSTFRRYNPNFQASTPNFQTGTDWTVPWACAIASVTWTKQEVGLNKETHTAKFRAQKYKSVLHQKYQNLYTDICNSIEAELWAAPDKTLMEDTTLPEGEARVPLSIPAFVNEFASGLHGGATGTGTWTTVQQISSSSQAKWQNQAQAYDADFDTAANAAKIFAPLSKLARKMNRVEISTRM